MIKTNLGYQDVIEVYYVALSESLLLCFDQKEAFGIRLNCHKYDINLVARVDFIMLFWQWMIRGTVIFVILLYYHYRISKPICCTQTGRDSFIKPGGWIWKDLIQVPKNLRPSGCLIRFSSFMIYLLSMKLRLHNFKELRLQGNDIGVLCSLSQRHLVRFNNKKEAFGIRLNYFGYDVELVVRVELFAARKKGGIQSSSLFLISSYLLIEVILRNVSAFQRG